MEEGSVMEEGSTNSRAGRWIKEIFKKKEEGEVEQNGVSDETPAANGHKTMELADISEEEEEMKNQRLMVMAVLLKKGKKIKKWKMREVLGMLRRVEAMALIQKRIQTKKTTMLPTKNWRKRTRVKKARQACRTAWSPTSPRRRRRTTRGASTE